MSMVQPLITYQDHKQLFENNSYEAVAIYDENLFCLDINKAFTRIFQYSLDEVIGKQPLFLVVPEDQQLIITNSQYDNPDPYEVRLVRKDGSIFTGLIQGETVFLNGKKHRVTTCRDISEIKEIQQQLRQKNNEFESLFQNSLVGITLLDKDRHIVTANITAANILGYKSGEEICGKSIQDIHISNENYESFSQLYQSELLQKKRITTEIQLKKRDGNIIWASVSGCLVSQQEPPSLEEGVVWVINDISRLKDTELQLKQAFEELEVVFNNALVGIVVLGSEQTIHKINQTLADMIGGSPAQWENRTMRDIHLSEASYLEFEKLAAQSLNEKNLLEFDFQIKGKNGQPMWVAISGKTIDKNGSADINKGIIWVIRDISDRKQMESELITLSRTDSLTGISNRRYFFECASREMAIMQRYPRKLSLLMLDLDHFKRVNDSKGHFVGDLALQLFTDVCKSVIRHIDLFGRLGGEEFAILLLETNIEDAKFICHRLQQKLTKATQTHQTIPLMTVSIGLIEVSCQEDIESALKRADKLLYKAKENGRNRIET